MGARGLATLAAAAVVVAGCGERDFKREARAPVPMQLTGVSHNDKVTVSPARNIGAGPFEIIVSNQTKAPHTITLEGNSIVQRVGPVQPLDTATIRKTLMPGSYEVRAGTPKAVRRAIEGT